MLRWLITFWSVTNILSRRSSGTPSHSMLRKPVQMRHLPPLIPWSVMDFNNELQTCHWPSCLVSSVERHTSTDLHTCRFSHTLSPSDRPTIQTKNITILTDYKQPHLPDYIRFCRDNENYRGWQFFYRLRLITKQRAMMSLLYCNL